MYITPCFGSSTSSEEKQHLPAKGPAVLVLPAEVTELVPIGVPLAADPLPGAVG